MNNTYSKKGMLFDLDGVLVDSEGEYSKFWGAMGEIGRASCRERV